MKYTVLLLTLFMCSIAQGLFAQTHKANKIEGIAAVVGDEIVLDSDVERDFQTAKLQGMEVKDRCEFLNNMLLEKVLIDRAKQDTLVVVTNDEVQRTLKGQIERFTQQIGSEKAVIDYFGFKTKAELENELQYYIRDNIYAREKRERVVSGLDATPEEVRMFFEEHKTELPDVKDEYSISHIILYPEIDPENEQKVIDELKQIKKDVEEGSSFATKAILYSEDPGSATNGGQYLKVKRGMMVKEFDAVAFNLDEGQVSEPFKTDFGYHIIQLEKRKGQELDLRHILITLKPTDEEIAKTKHKLDSIRILINEGKMSFKDAALRFSDDKMTKYNEGNLMNPQTGEDRFERAQMSANVSSALVGLNDGDISPVFVDEYENKKVVRLIRMNGFYPEHKINFEQDYSSLKRFTIRFKEQNVLMDWVKKQIPETFVKIGEDYKDCKFDLNWENN
ncbi:MULTISPECIES: peptidylprolyl isomerase [Weeksella]|uniref:PpiC-type peptidyl-prolyl cis-trans isomerase n=1 Tax=Weeksella virosa (strain ATCC 43766 / DSM 16922 / JCM 21250 / CCUG 30538 / CDC 9751 / IAM 14551 / NBRC 16016 / NCTC 11634 / CL345/78) TaxID=865938 RepID=F0NYI0_WEEVC|nr:MULTISPECIES: peptidylprolyl isomerase [Weeksella]ADX67100.1 PpiC-type peptidyl-prolyl cis-trans isomerase [Weeksella virosa DSM 16922]MDK7375658.1 peptidylprolyl isomerase [Weeksella virosa]MDK7675027.1 peptidylprolyl isomerase [Weeksella virosa]OFM82381.1 peptidylprolyl isomerase [Weeksella sp. HMSC059D05]SUP53371.1 Foldase protein prsA 3 precursor [Weeksella virosa]